MRTGTRKRAASISAIVASLITLPAFANYSCSGTVDSVTVTPGTGVVIFSSSSGLGAVYLCQIENTTSSANGAVTPAQCKAFLSILMTANATGQQVQFAFSDTLTCTTHPSWATLTGWYFGPMLLAN